MRARTETADAAAPLGELEVVGLGLGVLVGVAVVSWLIAFQQTKARVLPPPPPSPPSLPCMLIVCCFSTKTPMLNARDRVLQHGRPCFLRPAGQPTPDLIFLSRRRGRGTHRALATRGNILQGHGHPHVDPVGTLIGWGNLVYLSGAAAAGYCFDWRLFVAATSWVHYCKYMCVPRPRHPPIRP